MSDKCEENWMLNVWVLLIIGCGLWTGFYGYHKKYGVNDDESKKMRCISPTAVHFSHLFVCFNQPESAREFVSFFVFIILNIANKTLYRDSIPPNLSGDLPTLCLSSNFSRPPEFSTKSPDFVYRNFSWNSKPFSYFKSEYIGEDQEQLLY